MELSCVTIVSWSVGISAVASSTHWLDEFMFISMYHNINIVPDSGCPLYLGCVHHYMFFSTSWLYITIWLGCLTLGVWPDMQMCDRCAIYMYVISSLKV